MMLDFKRSLICTKPKNAKRFWNPWSRTVKFTMPCDTLLIYLCEDPALASQARAIGKFEYDAGADIDRYALGCSARVENLECCAAYEKMRQLVHGHALDGRKLDRQAVTVDIETDPRNGKKRITRVCDGDGRCGPISVEACDSLGPWVDELSKECENCSYRRNAADDKVGKGKGVAEGKGFEEVHGGIIAFILFAIVSALLLALCGCSGGVSIIDSPITAIRDQTKVLESIDKSLKTIAAAHCAQDIRR